MIPGTGLTMEFITLAEGNQSQPCPHTQSIYPLQLSHGVTDIG